MDTLRFDLKIFVNKIKNFIQENMPNGNIDFVTDTILNWESPFVLACKKICREKAFSSYFKTKDCYIEHAEKIVGYDYKTGKPDCPQIYSNTFDGKQLKVLLQQVCTRKQDCVCTASIQMISICLIISIRFLWPRHLKGYHYALIKPEIPLLLMLNFNN